MPNIERNLISVSELAKDNNVYFEFTSTNCYVKCQDTHKIILEGDVDSERLYVFKDFKLQHLPQSNSVLIQHISLSQNKPQVFYSNAHC